MLLPAVQSLCLLEFEPAPSRRTSRCRRHNLLVRYDERLSVVR